MTVELLPEATGTPVTQSTQARAKAKMTLKTAPMTETIILSA